MSVDWFTEDNVVIINDAWRVWLNWIDAQQQQQQHQQQQQLQHQQWQQEQQQKHHLQDKWCFDCEAKTAINIFLGKRDNCRKKLDQAFQADSSNWSNFKSSWSPWHQILLYWLWLFIEPWTLLWKVDWLLYSVEECLWQASVLGLAGSVSEYARVLLVLGSRGPRSMVRFLLPPNLFKKTYCFKFFSVLMQSEKNGKNTHLWA